MDMQSVSAWPLHIPMNIQLVFTWLLHTLNRYPFSIRLTPAHMQWIFDQYLPDHCIHPMDIHSVSAWPLHTHNEYLISIHQTPAYTQWIPSRYFTWPLHTPDEYSFSIHLTPVYTQRISDQYPPDSCTSNEYLVGIHLIPAIHSIDIQLVYTWPLCTHNKYLISICLTPAYIQSISSWHLPDPSIHPVNIRSVSTIQTFIICYIWYLPKMFVMLIEYLMGNNWVIWNLYQAVCLLDSIGYPISDIGKSYTGSLLVGHIIYTYWISFHGPI